MINDFLWVFCAVFILATGALHRPTRARCPPNEYVEGVRRDGSTWCYTTPINDPQDCSGTRSCFTTIGPTYTTPLKIYCDSQPIVADERTIECQSTRGY